MPGEFMAATPPTVPSAVTSSTTLFCRIEYHPDEGTDQDRFNDNLNAFESAVDLMKKKKPDADVEEKFDSANSKVMLCFPCDLLPIAYKNSINANIDSGVEIVIYKDSNDILRMPCVTETNSVYGDNIVTPPYSFLQKIIEYSNDIASLKFNEKFDDGEFFNVLLKVFVMAANKRLNTNLSELLKAIKLEEFVFDATKPEITDADIAKYETILSESGRQLSDLNQPFDFLKSILTSLALKLESSDALRKEFKLLGFKDDGFLRQWFNALYFEVDRANTEYGRAIADTLPRLQAAKKALKEKAVDPAVKESERVLKQGANPLAEALKKRQAEMEQKKAAKQKKEGDGSSKDVDKPKSAVVEPPKQSESKPTVLSELEIKLAQRAKKDVDANVTVSKSADPAKPAKPAKPPKKDAAPTAAKAVPPKKPKPKSDLKSDETKPGKSSEKKDDAATISAKPAIKTGPKPLCPKSGKTAEIPKAVGKDLKLEEEVKLDSIKADVAKSFPVTNEKPVAIAAEAQVIEPGPAERPKVTIADSLNQAFLAPPVPSTPAAVPPAVTPQPDPSAAKTDGLTPVGK